MRSETKDIETYIVKMKDLLSDFPNLIIQHCRIKNKIVDETHRDWKYLIVMGSINPLATYYTVTFNRVIYKVYINQFIDYKYTAPYAIDYYLTKYKKIAS